jgi:hypothetical protein
VLELVEEMREEMKAMREEMGGYAKKEEMSAIKAEFSAEPAAKPIKHNPETKQANKVEFKRPMQRQLTESLHVLTTNKHRKWQRPLQSLQTTQVNLRVSTSLLLF